MKNPFDLTGKSVFVSGASSGIGKATAVLLSSLGASLTISGRNVQRLDETFQILEGEGHRQIVCDFCDYDDTAAKIADTNKFDGVVYCIGTQKTGVAKSLTANDLKEVFDTNFNAVVNLNTLLFEGKKINKGASVVIVSSIAAYYPEVGNAAYSASKGALSAFAKVLALESAKRKIRVNTVSPAMVRTPLLQKFDVTDEQFAENEKKYPLGYSEPEDVAAAIAFLLSDGARQITGADIKIDGGLTLQ